MREKGFQREVVLETIAQCAPQAQSEQTERDWRRYAERATAHAFGVAGDVRLARVAVLREERERAEDIRQVEAVRETPRMR